MAAYYLRNRDKIRNKQNEYDKGRKQQKKQYYEDNKEAILNKRKQYYSCNRDAVIARVRLYRKLNKVKIQRFISNYIKTHRLYASKLGKAFKASMLLSPTIKERDQYRCRLCGTGKQLIIHHIIPKSINISLIEDTNNLITLCKACHLIAHDGCYARINNEIQHQLINLVKES